MVRVISVAGLSVDSYSRRFNDSDHYDSVRVDSLPFSQMRLSEGISVRQHKAKPKRLASGRKLSARSKT